MKNKITLAAIFLLLAPSLVFARISINDLATKLDAKPELRFVEQFEEVLDGSNRIFRIQVFCNDSFYVRSVYLAARDAVEAVDISFTRVSLIGDPFSGGPALTPEWLVDHQDFEITVLQDSIGYELLSNMKTPSLGVGANSKFMISGSWSLNTQTTTISIGAVVETSDNLGNDCDVEIVDF